MKARQIACLDVKSGLTRKPLIHLNHCFPTRFLRPTPDSGAIYLYDRAKQLFYMLGFDGPDDNLTPDEFDQLFEEYQLLRYAADPGLVHVRSVDTPTPACRSNRVVVTKNVPY